MESERKQEGERARRVAWLPGQGLGLALSGGFERNGVQFSAENLGLDQRLEV